MPAKELGEVQLEVLKLLREKGRYGNGIHFLWDSTSGTIRILDSLVRRGYATVSLEGKDNKPVYRPVNGPPKPVQKTPKAVLPAISLLPEGFYVLMGPVANPKPDRRSEYYWYDRSEFRSEMKFRIRKRVTGDLVLWSVYHKTYVKLDSPQARVICEHLSPWQPTTVEEFSYIDDWFDGTAKKLLQKLVDDGHMTIVRIREMAKAILGDPDPED